MERFLTECHKNQVITTTNHSRLSSVMSQPEFEADSCNRHQARENAIERERHVGVGFASHWLRLWREFCKREQLSTLNWKTVLNRTGLKTHLTFTLCQRAYVYASSTLDTVFFGSHETLISALFCAISIRTSLVWTGTVNQMGTTYKVFLHVLIWSAGIYSASNPITVIACEKIGLIRLVQILLVVCFIRLSD